MRATARQIAALADGKRPGKRRIKRYVHFKYVPSLDFDYWQLPIEVRSESNLREHWTKKNARKKQQQDMLWLINRADLKRWVKVYKMQPILITFRKIGGRRLDRSNLPVSFKGIEDALASMMGCNDGHDHWQAAWEQQPGGAIGIGIRIEVAS